MGAYVLHFDIASSELNEPQERQKNTTKRRKKLKMFEHSIKSQTVVSIAVIGVP
jgi:hypothetical protein